MKYEKWYDKNRISTHTLRGERDMNIYKGNIETLKFQLTRSVGSVTCKCFVLYLLICISTHTLRGERDSVFQISFETLSQFQLTRSVGSVTQQKKTAKW